MASNFNFLAEQLDALQRADRYRQLIPRTASGTKFVQNGRELTNFGSNDYLGLAAQSVSQTSPRGSGASALVCGWTDKHEQLASEVAVFESTESATVFPSGYAACSGVVAALPGERDLILSDQLNHASLIDGCRLSRAERRVYPHRDAANVKALLEQNRHRYDRVWIVTDGVFSMDGHVAPLVELCDLADAYDAILIVDEAHGTGVLGTTGSGVCEALGVKSRVPIRIGTLSKAIGSQGGFVAGPQVVIDYLINRCRPLIYSTSLSPMAVAAALDGLESIRKEPWRRDRVRQSSARIREALSRASLSQATLSGETLSRETSELESAVPIIAVVLGTDTAALAAARRLTDAGFYVPAIRPPTVPDGTARLRISLSAAHQDADIDALIAELTLR